MSGTYRLYSRGKLVAASKNIITSGGRDVLTQFMANEIGQWAGSLSVGADSTAAALADKRLGFEFARVPILSRQANTDTYNVTVLGEFPATVTGTIHEIGLWSLEVNSLTIAPGGIITDFSDTVQELVGGVENTTNVRVGPSSRSVTATAGNTSTVTIPELNKDFSSYRETDSFVLSYFLLDSNTASIRIRMLEDASNYFEYTIAPSGALDYKIVTWTKSQFVATGSPSWSSIGSLEVAVTASGGTTELPLDGFRINDDNDYTDFKLVSRSVLGTPYQKLTGEPLQFEYTIPINI